MKKLSLIAFLNIIVSFANAQTIPYEKLDSISSEISKLQLEVNGKVYNYGDSEVELSFPEENFKVYYHNQLATTSIYKKQNGKERLAITENIDFSKATGIVNSIRDSSILMISIYFPTGYLRTQSFENGVVVNTTNGDNLDFFKMKKQGGKNLSNYLFGLITSLQIAKGLTTETEISNQKKEFNNNLSKSEAEQFILKYPTSIYNLYLKNRIKQLEEEEEIIKIKLQKEKNEKIKKGDENFMNFTYFKGYKTGLTLEEAKIEYRDFFKRAKKSNFGVNTYSYLNKDDKTTQLFIKNGRLAGNSGKLIEPISDDANFTIGIKTISEIVSGLTTQFNLNPTITTDKFEQLGIIMNKTTYTWQKNGKSIAIIYTQNSHFIGLFSTATYQQFDKIYNE